MNLTMLYANLYIEENLQLMRQLIPQMKKVVYIGDGTYICQQNDYDLSETIAKTSGIGISVYFCRKHLYR